ncbi:MAG TPA: hypothetical protein VN975_01435 [Xanthobacteraceae bacterium]|nr:hypothetical protein [Xanthobacteraceae bacterium]
MGLDMRFALVICLAIAGLSSATLVPAPALAEVVCSGHRLLSSPRPESSCSSLKPRIYPSPDGALRALVLPVDVSLYATPDMESRVVIRTSNGDTVTSKDYSSPRGTNGYYVVNAKWSPDSQFFVYSMSSSGGHSPWSFPMMAYSREKKRIAPFSDMIDGKPTLSADFHFDGAHRLVAETWKAPGSLDHKVPVTVDLEDAFGKLPASD